MPVDPIFLSTSRIYDKNATAIRQRIGRRLNQAELDKVWLDAADLARQEAAQQQQIDVLGSAVDQAYAPMVQCEQAHEAATIDALEDLRRGARELTDLHAAHEIEFADQHDAREIEFADQHDAREIEFADQHDDWRDWQWSIGDLGL